MWKITITFEDGTKVNTTAENFMDFMPEVLKVRDDYCEHGDVVKVLAR